MKRAISLVLVFSLLFLVSCSTAEKELYGAWYNDTNGVRNAIQFSENDKGQTYFVWAIYDIESNTVTSNARGYYSITGSTMTLTYFESDTEIELKYSLDGDTLTLTNNGADLVLTKYEIS